MEIRGPFWKILLANELFRAVIILWLYQRILSILIALSIVTLLYKICYRYKLKGNNISTATTAF